MITVSHNKYGSFINVDSHNERLSALDAHYAMGLFPPSYPVPAIPLKVKYDYIGCVNIDDVTDPDDPVIVWMYDSWTGFNLELPLR